MPTNPPPEVTFERDPSGGRYNDRRVYGIKRWQHYTADRPYDIDPSGSWWGQAEGVLDPDAEGNPPPGKSWRQISKSNVRVTRETRLCTPDWANCVVYISGS